MSATSGDFLGDAIPAPLPPAPNHSYNRAHPLSPLAPRSIVVQGHMNRVKSFPHCVRIVDDHQPTIDLFKIWGRQIGVSVIGDVDDLDSGYLFTPDAWEGVEVAIVDLRLTPDMTGFDILRWLCANEPHIRRVVSSGAVTWADSQALEQEGLADVVLPKGFSLNAFEAILYA